MTLAAATLLFGTAARAGRALARLPLLLAQTGRFSPRLRALRLTAGVTAVALQRRARIAAGLHRGMARGTGGGEAAGGDNRAPNSIELLLASFAAGTEAAFSGFAEQEGRTIASVEADVEGTLDLRGLFMSGGVPAGFREVGFALRVVSPEDESRVRALAEKVLNHCPVVDSLKKPKAVTGGLEIRRPEKPPGPRPAAPRASRDRDPTGV